MRFLADIANITRLNNEGSIHIEDNGWLSVMFGENTDGNLYVEDGGTFQPLPGYAESPVYINDSKSKISVEKGGYFRDTTVENFGEFKNEGTTSVNKFRNNEGGVLITGFNNLSTTSGAIYNDGLMQFSAEGDITNFDIKGRGEVEIDKNINNLRAIHQGKVTVKDGKIFNTLVGNKYIVDETVNDGEVILSKGGDIIGGFSGNGRLTLDYDDPMSMTEYTFIGKNGQKVKQKDIDIYSSVRVINNSVLEFSDSFKIGNMSTVYTQADDIISAEGNSITNWGTLRLEGGTNHNTIKGSGKTVIEAGSVFNEALIDQELEIDYDTEFTSELKNIGSYEFTNTGIFNLLGDLSGTIQGSSGKTILQDSIVKASNGTEIEGMLDMNGAVLDMRDGGLTTVNIGGLNGKGDLKIDITAGKDNNNSDKINILDASNNSVLNLTNIKITNQNDITEADRGKYNNALTYVDGNADNINYKIKGKTGENAIYRALDKLNLYEFTLGDKGKLNVNITDNPLNLDDYINGTNGIITSVDVYNVILDTELTPVITGNGGFFPEDKIWTINLNNGSKISAKDNINQNDGVTITKDAIFNIDGSHKAGASIENFKTAVINNGTLNVNDVAFKNNTTDIENNASLNLSGTNNIENIAGDNGTTSINGGQTEISNITQDKLNVSKDTVLKVLNADIKTEIVNDGKIQTSDKVNNTAITGAGTLEILGNMTNEALITQNNLSIADLASLTSVISSLHIKNDILNNGTLELTGSGTLFNNINGIDNSQTKISGDIINNAVINQDVYVSENGTLTSSFDGLNKTVTNNGIFNIQGDLKKDISGTGTTVLQDKNVNVINNRTQIDGSLDLNGKTIDMRDAKGLNQNLSVGALKGEGNLKIDVDMSKAPTANSDTIELMSKDNNATINLSAINITKDIKNNGSFEDYINYVKGYTNGVNFKIGGSEDGELVVLTNGLKYTFTKGDDGYLNAVSQMHTGGLSEYIIGEIIAENYSVNDDMIVLGSTDMAGKTQ